jgi:hypothetical protein
LSREERLRRNQEPRGDDDNEDFLDQAAQEDTEELLKEVSADDLAARELGREQALSAHVNSAASAFDHLLGPAEQR